MIFADEGGTEAFGRALGTLLAPGDVVAISGPLGAGKTVLARGLLAGAGHGGEVASPTFPIVLPYDGPGMRLPVLHADLYRVERPDELDELGLDDALLDGALVVEWPERAGLEPWPQALRLELEPDGEPGGNHRRLTVRVPPSWSPRWPPPPPPPPR